MKIKLSKPQWEKIGEESGWMKTSQSILPEDLEELEQVDNSQIENSDSDQLRSTSLAIDIYQDTDRTYLRYSSNGRSAVISDIDSYNAWELLDHPFLIVTVYSLDSKPTVYTGQEAIEFMGF